MSNNKDTLALHAHTMRQAPTESEARLWRALRSSRLGVAFRRQVPLLGFIADFYAPSARLIVVSVRRRPGLNYGARTAQF